VQLSSKLFGSSVAASQILSRSSIGRRGKSVKESVEGGGMSPFFDKTQCWEWWYMKKRRLISLILKERRRK
jgi:hypothetical protein